MASWDISNVSDMCAMFWDCSSLVDLSGLAGWDVSDVADMMGMFRGCGSIEKYPKWYR
ncbi:BspA family leucine-rich repeat surface protein [Methanobrevibacter sp.]